MAKKKKGFDPVFPDPKEVRGAVWKMAAPAETKLMFGLGALFLGAATLRYAPKLAAKMIPMLVSAFTPPEGWQPVPLVPYHPEGAEPIETLIDERQLGRSEVISELAHPKRN
jgi:hypothetical protein